MDVTGQRHRAVNEYRHAKRTHDDYAGAEEIADELIEDAMSLVVRQLSSDFDQIDPPEVIEKIEPEYSLEGRMAELEGTVRVQGVIGADGFARELRVISHLGLGLDERAVEAVQKWKSKPGSYRPAGSDEYRRKRRIPARIEDITLALVGSGIPPLWSITSTCD